MKLSNVKKYKITYNLAVALYPILMLTIFFAFDSISLFVITFLCLFPVFYLVKCLLFKKYIYSTLTKETDARKFGEVLKEGKFLSKTYSEYIIQAYCSGDYKTALNLSTTLLANPSYKKYKYVYLCCIAICYFRADDLEKLREVCNRFNEEVAKDSKSEKIKKRYPVFEFYTSYLNGDYELCKEYLFDKKARVKDNLNTVSIVFNLAVVYYKSGDFKNAKERFEQVLALAPNLDVYDISKRYINAIENGYSFVFPKEAVEIDENYKNPYEQLLEKKKQRTTLARIISIILCIIALMTLTAVSIVNKYNGYYDQKIGAITDYPTFYAQMKNRINFKNYNFIKTEYSDMAEYDYKHKNYVKEPYTHTMTIDKTKIKLLMTVEEMIEAGFKLSKVSQFPATKNSLGEYTSQQGVTFETPDGNEFTAFVACPVLGYPAKLKDCIVMQVIFDFYTNTLDYETGRNLKLPEFKTFKKITNDTELDGIIKQLGEPSHINYATAWYNGKTTISHIQMYYEFSGEYDSYVVFNISPIEVNGEIKNLITNMSCNVKYYD